MKSPTCFTCFAATTFCLWMALRPVVSFTPSTPHPLLQRHPLTSASSLTKVFMAAESQPSPASKGFGDKKEIAATNPSAKTKSSGAVQREQSSAKYDEISAAGGQEYRIFVRQFGSSDTSWLPCGAIAVPRGSQVSDAIYANVEGLKTAITRSYPKLKGMEEEFEFGFNLKVYPDDPIEVAKRNAPRAQGLSLGNWINTLLSPVDASEVKRPNVKE